MIDRHRTPRGQSTSTCEHTTDRGQRCKTIPAASYRFCPHHHLLECRRRASNWRDQSDGPTHRVQLPSFSKPIHELSFEEQTALGIYVAWQLEDRETPESLRKPNFSGYAGCSR